MARFTPDEDAALLPYVDRCADWKAALARLPRRSLAGARRRLVRLRKQAGTVWRIDQSDRARTQAAREVDMRRERGRKQAAREIEARRERARDQPRAGGKFA